MAVVFRGWSEENLPAPHKGEILNDMQPLHHRWWTLEKFKGFTDQEIK